MAISISDLDGFKNALEEGRDIEIRDPEGNELGLTITVVSLKSDRVRATVRRLANARFKRMQGKSPRITVEENEEAVLETLVAAVISWDGILDKDGKPLPCTKENVRTVLESYEFIRAQVDEAADDESAFFTK
jgi:hypothetical protein